MELKTKVAAGEGSQDLVITRTFDLPVELLFKAYVDPELIAQWMGTRVVEFENEPLGCYRFETTDQQGNVVFSANGVMHELVQNERITRTFQMENTPFPVQLEFLEFQAITTDTSRLVIQIVFKSAEYRNQLLQMPFASGLNMAHNRLEAVVKEPI